MWGALAHVPMLSSLDRKHLEKLAKDFTDRTFPAGPVIVRQGDDRGIGFFVIADGEAIVSVDGAEVARLGPGTHFGAIALIAIAIERQRSPQGPSSTPT